MASEPTVTIVGNLTSDAEVRWSSSGKPIGTMRIANNPRVKDGDTWRDGEPTFCKVTIFGPDAEMAAECLRKGQQVIATGRLRTERWEKDGEKRETLSLIADAVGPTVWRFQRVTAERVSSDGGGQQRPAQGDPWGQPKSGGWGNANPGAESPF